MKLLTLNNNDLTLCDYSEAQRRQIFTERNAYVLKCVHSWGVDYGGSQCSENCKTSYEEIIPERILVRDNHFCGVLIIEEYDFYNGGGETTIREVLLLTDGSGDTSARCGSDFSNDDHSRWNYCEYYLVERPED